MLATLAPSAVAEFRLVRRLCTHTVKESISGSPVYTNGHFCVEPCVTCFVPGYLIVTPQLPAASLSDLQRDALASLGPTLAAVTIQQITRFQVHGCWIGLGAHSIIRFPATTPKLFKRFFVNSTTTSNQSCG